MKQYLKSKESGLEWIGKIPEHWNTKKLKFTCIVNPPKSEVNNLPDDFKISFLPMDKIGEDGKLTLDEIKNLAEVKNGFTYFRDGDVIIAKITPCFENGKGSLCNELENGVGFGTTELHVLRPQKEFDPLFTFYWTRSDPFMQTGESLMYGAAGQKRIPTEFIKDFVIAYPKLIKEQETIAKFLKNQLTQIDEDIDKNQKLIGLLKEKRNTLINKVMTKGLHYTIPMKHSGIEWIGKIPEHWVIQKIKHTSYVKGRIGWQGLRSDEFTEKGPYLITGTDFGSGKINWETCHHVEQWRYDQDPYIQIKNEDVLITKDGTIGKIALVNGLPGSTTLNTGVMVIRPLHDDYLPSYLFWILQSQLFKEFIDMIKSGSTIKHLYQETFENFQFVLPDTLDEQREIVEFIHKNTVELYSIIYKTTNQNEKFQEYRQSLISAAVTGKIDVRQEVVA